MYNMDKLYEAVTARGHVCTGLDTAAGYIPKKELSRHLSEAEAVLEFNIALIDATIDLTACYKVQIAYYEQMGLAGLKTYSATLKYLREKGALVIADIKRGDIADTASRYAQAHFDGDFEADFVTLTPYLGMDSIDPWVEWTEKKGKGAFVLMRTSNKGRMDFECLTIKDSDPSINRTLYDAVGDKLSELAEKHKGRYGYGAFGAVVGADPQTPDERKEAIAIRSKRSNLFFLIPGYGAQGGAASDAALLLREGNGGVVNASRSILKAWNSAAKNEGLHDDDVTLDFAAQSARQAVMQMRDALKKAVKNG